MKTLSLTVVIVAALACSACGKCSTAKMPVAPTLPTQFAGDWKVDAGCSPSDTGLDVGDIIAVEQRPGLKITLLPGHPTHGPNPVLLQNVTLTVVNPDDATNKNVLKPDEADRLCKVSPAGFGKLFWEVLMKHNFKLTYVAGAGQLDSNDPHEYAQLVLLPYLIEGEESEPAHFLLAVVDPVHLQLHNGIVHAKP